MPTQVRLEWLYLLCLDYPPGQFSMGGRLMPFIRRRVTPRRTLRPHVLDQARARGAATLKSNSFLLYATFVGHSKYFYVLTNKSPSLVIYEYFLI